jgi:hypothetical protein
MPRRLLAVAAVVAAVAIAAVVIATQRGSQPALGNVIGRPMAGVSVVLAHATIHRGATDRAVVVNGSRYWLAYGGCAGLWPRTSPEFKLPPNTVGCLSYIPIAPHSRFPLPGVGLEDSIRAHGQGPIGWCSRTSLRFITRRTSGECT